MSGPRDIQLNETVNFFVFRVVVGRSFVIKKSTLQDPKYRHNPRSALHPDYDSIYIQDDQDESDYVSHTYRIFDKEKVKLIYKVQAKIKIPNSTESLTPLCEQCKANLGLGREEAASLGHVGSHG